MSAIVVLSSVPSNFDVRPFARMLVEDRVAACVNITAGVTSIYRWKGAVEEEGEQLLFIKTTSDRLEALRERFATNHPYEVPEFIVIKADTLSDTYAAWLAESVS